MHVYTHVHTLVCTHKCHAHICTHTADPEGTEKALVWELRVPFLMGKPQASTFWVTLTAHLLIGVWYMWTRWALTRWGQDPRTG